MTVKRYDELPARLRGYKWVADPNPCPEAADAIEALSAKLEQSRQWMRHIDNDCGFTDGVWKCHCGLAAFLASLESHEG